MDEIVTNLHMHTGYSDGSGSHLDLANAALRCGVDVIIVTDHNVLVDGMEGYYKNDRRKVLMLVGEEIHDQDRAPQKNHLLVLGAGQELAAYADEPQQLLNAVKELNGLSFLAHPYDPPSAAFHEPDISWVDWDITNFTGIELWNGFSEFKSHIPSQLHGLFFAFFPALVARGPRMETLRKWDELLAARRVVAVGGSDAHALRRSLGPIKREIFSYDFHFQSINTHIYLKDKLSGDVKDDRQRVLQALSSGHCFIGYDLPASTRGFRFTAQGFESFAIMGDEIPGRGGITLLTHLPAAAEIRLLKDGRLVRTVKGRQDMTYITTEPGVYRVEAYRNYLGRRCGWIFSNPIYIR